MDKSYVTLEEQVCVVCGATFDTGDLLLDTQLRQQFDMHTVTGWGLCETHQELHDKGFIALVAIDPTKSKRGRDGNVSAHDAYRTGHVIHVLRDKWAALFSVPCPDVPLVFIDDDTAQFIESIVNADQQPDPNEADPPC